MKTMLSVLAAVAGLALASPAFAFHCPKDMSEIDAALPKAMTLSADERKQVMDYRMKGEELHKAGNHQASVDTLAKAKAILGLR
ncbi:MAG: hypothetical protein H7841_13855 [Magnetospirillum sp. WYHS-4]